MIGTQIMKGQGLSLIHIYCSANTGRVTAHRSLFIRISRFEQEQQMTKKQAAKAVVFLAGFLFILMTVTYIIRTNGDVKDRFTGFYAEKDDTIDVITVSYTHLSEIYRHRAAKGAGKGSGALRAAGGF